MPPWERNSVGSGGAEGEQGLGIVQGGVGDAAKGQSGLAFDEEAKLVYGIVFSLRNLVSKLDPRYVRPAGLAFR